MSLYQNSHNRFKQSESRQVKFEQSNKPSRYIPYPISDTKYPQTIQKQSSPQYYQDSYLNMLKNQSKASQEKFKDINADFRCLTFLTKPFFDKNQIYKKQVIGGINFLSQKLKTHNKAYIKFKAKRQNSSKNVDLEAVGQLDFNLKLPIQSYEYIHYHKRLTRDREEAGSPVSEASQLVKQQDRQSEASKVQKILLGLKLQNTNKPQWTFQISMLAKKFVQANPVS